VIASPVRAGAATVASIILLAINLRTVLASFPPLVPDVRADLGLSATATGLITTLPVLCMGAFATLAPRLARRHSIERLLVAMMIGTAVGAGLRGIGTTAALAAGTLVAGVSIALAQALLPVLVRARYPAQSGALTGTFSMAFTLGATMAAGSAVPLENALGGWSASLAVWAVPPVVAAVIWSLAPGRTVIDRPPPAALWRRPVAWAVALFFGIQSMAFYATLSWLPSILEDAGRSPETAGALLALSSLVQLPTAFLAPTIAARLGHQVALLSGIVLVAAAGMAGLLLAPGVAPLWIVLVGIGQGGALGLGMMLPLLRGGEAHTAASLTAMTLTVGYLVAATGPWLVGAVHDLSGDWTAPLAVMLGITLLELVPGIAAARARTITKNGA
jgi:CP family cyanate transporter-like MFS transporter